ncbi:3-carboxy-cis,cis-muconate cycloisomerase [Emticicia aquatica]|uniref:3-carboxy-cis,cis-muconate cycloisomerase n=1 Tax=Emticicia aquatica TaxID=1681835 RepID=A0ABN8ERA0_9BACT|nr:3-carboxy-cis,cis-muconate cycloisomerase [Emticicia aquatica]CAH0994400.1 3-carboxy-cis,cis-muconate cycloisomerase [Emticicia aquatica]
MSLYSELFYSKAINELFSDQNLVAQMLQFEAVLAVSQAKEGIIPPSMAEIIGHCCEPELIDFEKLRTAIKLSGNAAIPLVKQLTEIIKNKDTEAAKYVHFGATSQDVVDTAIVLQIKDFMDWLEEKIILLEHQLIAITKKHRNTVMIGRTLLQQAKPITFGLKTALYLESITRSKERILEVKKRVLVIQLAGAVGSQNQNISTAVKRQFAQILDLNYAHSWHTNRDNFAEFAAFLGVLVGNLGKIAKDISLLMQTEVGEVFEGASEGKGGSSTMPHKRNPVTSTAILANASRVPNLVATMLTTMPQEHERSVGLWHAEWEVLTEIMLLTAGTVERSIELIESLELDKTKMLQNLELTKGLIYAENVSLELAKKIGKSDAHELVEKACKLAISADKHLKEVLQDLKVDLPNIDELFNPENSIGLSLEIIDEILDKIS